MDRVCIRAVTLVLLLAFSKAGLAEEKKKINILSWWGYLSADGIKAIEKNCNADIYVDEYYSSSEFLRRWQSNSDAHSLIIYSNTIYNVVNARLSFTKIPNLISTPYHPLVADAVQSLGLTSSTRLLTLSFTGFMWNKKNIDIHEQLSIGNMLGQANGKVVIVLDDPVEGLEILNNLEFFHSSQDKEEMKSKVVITNDIESLVKQPNFSFSYHWLGGSIAAINKLEGDFGLMVHPSLSHVTADLITIQNSDLESICVYNYIAGKEFLSNLQNESFYFSPYGGINKTDNKYLAKLYEDYFLKLNNYRWLKQVKIKDFKKVEDEWKKLKIQLSN